MRLSSNVKRLRTLFLHPQILTGGSKYLFVLSHMRSRSSVLAHVLGSHPGICGYREWHIPYLNRLGLARLRLELYHELKCDLRGKYLLDKLLHNSETISEAVYKYAQPRIIFLLRDPVATIKSIIDMRRIMGASLEQAPANALKYYSSRLSFLAQTSQEIGGRYFFLESNDLVERTDQVLTSLSSWLELDEPLRREYSTFKSTGRPGSGDPSENIKRGVVAATEPHDTISIPDDILEMAKLSYLNCIELLLRDMTNRHIAVTGFPTTDLENRRANSIGWRSSNHVAR